MKRTSTFLVGIFLLVMLSVGEIAAGERGGPRAFILQQIGVLVDAVDELWLEGDDQQDQLDSQQDQICALYAASGLPFPLECISLTVCHTCPPISHVPTGFNSDEDGEELP